MSHSLAAVAPWMRMVPGKRFYVTSRLDDMKYWQNAAAGATKRWRTHWRWVARRADDDRIYIVRSAATP